MVIAYLQGYMGEGYVMSAANPKAALIISGEYSFWGGDPNSADAKYLTERLFDVLPSDYTIGIFAKSNPKWEETLLAYRDNNPVVVPRFGIAQKDYAFDNVLLQGYVDSISDDFTIIPINENLYEQAMRADWSKEFCETFSSAEDYLARGFGFAAVKDGKLVSGASTMTVYDGGAELQIATHPDFRKMGLALPCAATFILECVRRNMRPCWDAANEISLKMALKLGYEYEGEYTTIHMRRQ
jgi:GNAT superfamily N-acetyltransferase